MTKLKLLHLKNIDIYSALKIEESLLKNNEDDDSYFIITENAPKSIVMGISNKPEKLLHIDKIKNSIPPIPVIKRFSGGGTIISDENTIFFTLIISHKLLAFSCPKQIITWVYDTYKNAFEKNDLFSLYENDFAIKDKKCCGSALYIKKNRWLHHCSFLWNYDINNMNLLKKPTKAPSYRNDREHKDFLSPLHPLFEDKNIFIEKIIASVEKKFDLQFVSIENLKIYQKNISTEKIAL